MLRKTMIVLAAATALTAGLTADAFALATARSNWDGLGGVGEHDDGFGGGAHMGGGFDGDHFGHPGGGFQPRLCGSAPCRSAPRPR